MGEVTEKIYCCDRGDNDNALAAGLAIVAVAVIAADAAVASNV